MARKTLILLVSLLAVAAPSMALTINVNTQIPEYVMQNHLNLTGQIEPDVDVWTDTGDVDFLSGTTSAVKVTEGSVLLKPSLSFAILNSGAPVFRGSNTSTWDTHLFNKHIVYDDGTFYMYYSASTSETGSRDIGLATSSDGTDWTRYSGNPVLTSGSESYDYGQLDWPVVMKDGSSWRMWYAGNASANDVNICYANSTDGYNWTKSSSNPVLSNGANAADWDGLVVRPAAVYLEAGNYTLYYQGSGFSGVIHLGVAISSNGVSWTKSSDNPLYRGELGSWNKGVFNGTTLEQAHGTYRFLGYGGLASSSLGYITSNDGINWIDSGGAIFTTKPNTIYSVGMSNDQFIDRGTYYYMNMLCVNETERSYGAFRVRAENLTGTYTSRQFTVDGMVTLNDMNWTAVVPEGGRLMMYLRWYNKTTDPVVWQDVGNTFRFAGVTAKYFQYRAEFIAFRDWFNVRLDDVTLNYTVNVADVSVRVGTGNWMYTNGTTLDWWINLTVPNGDYVISICATDSRGGHFLRNLPVKVDLYAPAGSILLEGGAIATDSTLLEYTTTATDTHGVVEMMVSTDPTFTGVPWSDYDTSGSLQWNGGDGVVTVYVRYRDSVGRVSTAFNDTIIVDTSPPVASMRINGGANFTKSRDVVLDLDYSDLTGVVSMIVSNNPDFAGSKWKDPLSHLNWSLDDIDGTQAVYVRLKDVFDATVTLTQDIVLDRVAPTITITLDGGASHTTDVDVELVVDISDASPVRGKMWNSEDPMPTELVAVPSHTKTSWRLTEGNDGTRGVEVLVVDAAGNEAHKVVSITLDRTPPVVTMLIDDGAKYTSETVVVVTLMATDETSGINKMRVSSSGDFTSLPWEALKTSFGWPIGSEVGTQFVYVQVSDNAGLITTVAGTIILDKTAPTGSFTIDSGAAFSTKRTVELELDFEDDFELESMRVGNSPDLSSVEWGSYTNLSAFELPEQEGERIVWVEVRDKAGNTWRTSTSIVLDMTDPIVSVSIEDGGEATYTLDARVLWSASDTSGLVQAWFSTDPTFAGATPVTLDGLKTIDRSPRQVQLSGSDGRKSVYVRVRDAAGRMGVGSDEIWFVSVAPGGNIVAGSGTGWTNTTTVSVRITDPVGSPTHLRLAGTKAGLASAPWERLIDPHTIELPGGDGEKTFFVELLADHNLSSGAKSVVISLDTVKPTIELRKALPKSTSEGSVVLDVVGRDMMDQTPLVRWRLNDGQWFDMGATPPKLTLKDGRNRITIQVIDAAGNTVTETYTVEKTGALGTTLIAVVVIAVVAAGLVAFMVLRKRGGKGASKDKAPKSK